MADDNNIETVETTTTPAEIAPPKKRAEIIIASVECYLNELTSDPTSIIFYVADVMPNWLASRSLV
ncbi:hypothetical protein QM996_30140 (plasmid) [Sinorhizobium chiapasense]|uniref:hypothetical protein n=1 Tax=Sinorhizobium chiapasense TaxID=501572 RepID=UPI002FE35D3E